VETVWTVWRRKYFLPLPGLEPRSVSRMANFVIFSRIREEDV